MSVIDCKRAAYMQVVETEEAAAQEMNTATRYSIMREKHTQVSEYYKNVTKKLKITEKGT